MTIKIENNHSGKCQKRNIMIFFNGAIIIMMYDKLIVMNMDID